MQSYRAKSTALGREASLLFEYMCVLRCYQLQASTHCRQGCAGSVQCALDCAVSVLRTSLPALS